MLTALLAAFVGSAADAQGTESVATEQGHVVRFRAGRFTNIPFEGQRPAGDVPTLVADSLGAVWVGRLDGLWTVRGDRLRRVGQGSLDVRVTAIAQRRDGGIWIGTDGAGVFRVADDGQVTKVATNPAIEGDYLNGIVEDAAGTLWTDYALSVASTAFSSTFAPFVMSSGFVNSFGE